MTGLDLNVGRRAVLGAAGAAGVLAVARPAPAFARRPGRTVAVLGGGMAGLAAAHELIERGFDVTVYEPKAWGGKARSIPVKGTGTEGRRDLPGEHGFRFFPG
ncbi:MAG: FAD-dependent oxidoreductase, partial [Nocardioides sp.]